MGILYYPSLVVKETVFKWSWNNGYCYNDHEIASIYSLIVLEHTTIQFVSMVVHGLRST